LGSGYPPAWNFESIQKKEEHLNCTWLHGKKKGVMDAAKGLLVAFVTALTLIVLIVLLGLGRVPLVSVPSCAESR
jgi:hypothetical protein